MKEKNLHLLVAADNEEPFSVTPTSVRHVWAAALRHLGSFVTRTLNSCCIYQLFPERSWTIEELQHTARWCWPVCLHQSASYLATDEDARRCDHLPVSGKCVFHLVGEKSGEEKGRREGAGQGEIKPTRESVRQTVKGKICRANSAKLKTKWKINTYQRLGHRPTSFWSIVFFRSNTGWVCILFEEAIRQKIEGLTGAAVNWPYLLFT